MMILFRTKNNHNAQPDKKKCGVILSKLWSRRFNSSYWSAEDVRDRSAARHSCRGSGDVVGEVSGSPLHAG